MNACLFLATLHSEDVLRLLELGDLYAKNRHTWTRPSSEIAE